jgi:hypothetical protein
MSDKAHSQNFIGKTVYNFASAGDAVIPVKSVRSIKVDSIMNTWFGYVAASGEGCFGEQMGVLPNDQCIKVHRRKGDHGEGVICTRICSFGLF